MSNIEEVSIATPNLGDRSYVVGRGSTAVVIDPQRDIDRVEEILAERGWTATHVLETHFHNDYVSGGLELAKALGAEYVVPDGMAISFAAHQVTDKTELDTGVLLRQRWSRRPRTLHRRLDALRQCGAPRPARPGTH